MTEHNDDPPTAEEWAAHAAELQRLREQHEPSAEERRIAAELEAVDRRRDELKAEMLAWHRIDPDRYPLPPEMLQQGDWTWQWVSDAPDDASSLTDGEDD